MISQPPQQPMAIQTGRRSFSSGSEQALLEELRALEEAQSKLSFLLAEIQRLPLPAPAPASGPAAQSIRSGRESLADDAVSLRSAATSSLAAAPDASWSVAMVAEWVKQKGAGDDVVRAFVDQDIDGAVLLSLTGEDLKTELGVLSFGLRRKILLAIEKARQ
ncbi:hypothetical protein BDR26DRAFT_850919 [Obelidium mucronatum]|nr:hypothetical protein BDR26DRAFT_850919 [Obelidium mucronatum]